MHIVLTPRTVLLGMAGVLFVVAAWYTDPASLKNPSFDLFLGLIAWILADMPIGEE